MAKRRVKKRKNSRILFIILGILILALIVLAFIEFGIIEKIKKKEIIHINIQDKCSFAMNDFLHQIRDDSDCSNICISRCYTLNKEIHKSEFTDNPEGCNECDCYCK